MISKCKPASLTRSRFKHILNLVVSVTSALALSLTTPPTHVRANPVQTKKPNIVVIFADDVGIWNISAYHRGMMGGSTTNIDRLAKEGALFTDYYAQQSCTAGRAAFITGQIPFRTGLLKVGLPGAKQGLQDKDPTIVNQITSHEDWLPTFLAAAGDPDIKTKLLTSLKVGDKTFRLA